MFSHVMLGSDDLDRSKIFYDALFASVGGGPGIRDDRGLVYRHNGGSFLIRPPLNGQPASHGNGTTIGFSLASPEEVDSWHKAGAAAGGKAIEDPPGVRFNLFYAAYLLDPDGNKLCGLHSLPGK